VGAHCDSRRRTLFCQCRPRVEQLSRRCLKVDVGEVDLDLLTSRDYSSCCARTEIVLTQKKKHSTDLQDLGGFHVHFAKPRDQPATGVYNPDGNTHYSTERK
jgi:hypothetical protein